jgi:hypothetical protein
MTRLGEVAASTRCGQSASGSSSVLVRLNLALSVEHSGVMAESTDQRIKNILQKKAKEKEAAEQAKKQVQERSNERQAIAENVRKKWSADTHIIAEILKDFEQKMSALGLQLAFQDEGQKGDALAGGRIFGRVSGSDLQVTLNVDPAGEIHAFQGPKAGHIAVQFTSPSKLSVLTADRAQYEALILDFIERGT